MGTPFVQPSAMGYNVGAPLGLSSTQPIDDRQMSRLPVESQPWPPPDQTPIAFSHRIWDAWHTGDRQKLAWCYYLERPQTTSEPTRLTGARSS